VLSRIPLSDNRRKSERFEMRSTFFKKNRNGSVALKGLGPDRSRESACQSGPSFAAAAAQHFSAAFSGHAFTESVIPGSAQSAGLKWSFHICTS
jgi:hypothetical protein